MKLLATASPKEIYIQIIDHAGRDDEHINKCHLILSDYFQITPQRWRF